MVKRLAIIFTALLLFAGTVSAQKYAYQVGVTDKDINVDMLGLPGSTPLEDVLAFLPEFLNNPELSLTLGGYDIQIEDISVDGAANSVIKHMHLSDLKSITITENPSASQQKNGSGGVINLKLNDVPDGFSGRASLNLSTASMYQPSAMLNYHKDKLTVRSWLMYDLHRPGPQNEYRTLTTEDGNVYAIDTVGTKSSSQMVRVYVDYRPTSKDEIQLRVWESTSTSDKYKYKEMMPGGDGSAGGSIANEANTLAASGIYTHNFQNGHCFKFEPGYLYMPQYGKDERRNPLNVGGDPSKVLQTLSRTHQFDGKISYSLPVIKSGEEVHLEMKVGSNMTLKSAGNEFSENSSLAAALGIPSHVDGDIMVSYPESSLSLSPYMELGGGWSTLQYKLNLKYQYLRNSSILQDGTDDVYTYSKDLTGNFNIAWQMTPHQHLRLVLDRSIIQPSSWQMLPVMVYRPDMGSHVKGNPGLLSSKLNSATLNYVTDIHPKTGSIVLNASLGLIHSEGLIGTVHEVSRMESLIPYITYENSGSGNILKANLLCCYMNGPLMLTFSSNFFDKLEKIEGKTESKVYSTLCFASVYRITDKWTVAGELTYNKPFSSATAEYSPSFNGALRISKVWEKLESFVAVSNILHKARWEITRSPELTTYRYYDLYPSSVTFGMSYHF